ncbi:hypothetical protein KC644_04290 [Candidatus Berkelbacteria bacterium]|nr:hypothetical protein [Candidatus Berkelbacteria bacterium]
MILIESLIGGFYFYFVQQLIFLIRFGRFNSIVNQLDLSLYIIGAVAIFTLLKLLSGKNKRQQAVLLGVFIVAQPLAIIGALAGGQLGLIPIIIFGLAPILALLLIANLIVKKLK